MWRGFDPANSQIARISDCISVQIPRTATANKFMLAGIGSVMNSLDEYRFGSFGRALVMIGASAFLQYPLFLYTTGMDFVNSRFSQRENFSTRIVSGR
jgi:hypothetical protein